MFDESYKDVFAGDEAWQSLPTPEGKTFAWDPESTYVRKPPYFDGMPDEPEPVTDIEGARVLLKLGDSVTTDHISPAGAIKKDSPAGTYLAEHGVEQRDFNSYGSRRGNHEVMIRGTFANIRLRNQLAPGHRGRLSPATSPARRRTVTSVFEASENYIAAGTPLVVLCGKEYGSGSSRDWAAKGTSLLGVKAVIAESYERIHRSNLIGMGVIPLQFPEGENAESLGLTGEETFSITGITELNEGRTPKTVKVTAGDVEFDAVVRIDTPGEANYYRNGGIMQYVHAPVTTIYEASEAYAEAGTPLVVLCGKEYGSGSSRDWAAKGTSLLGVKAVIAESYERIHRSNLIGMGVIPLQFPEGQNAESLGLTGEETFSISGITGLNEGSTPKTVKVTADGTEFDAVVRIDTPGEANYYRNGGIMQYVLRNLRKA